jgi:hypothetical protein
MQMAATKTLYVVVKDNIGEDYGGESEDMLVTSELEDSFLVFESKGEAERHREEIIEGILDEYSQTPERIGLTRENGHIFIWDGAECYRIAELQLIKNL